MRVSRPATVTHLRSAFTVLELLLSVAIMTVIIIGLYTVFDQTQKALRGTVSQVDVLESIRATSDLVGRDLEGISYVPLPNYTNLYVANSSIASGVTLNGLGGNALFTTVFQDIFFHRRFGQEWTAVGYWVGPLTNRNVTPPIHVGRLYRFSTNVTPGQVRLMGGQENKPWKDRNPLLDAFISDPIRYSAPVMDGVVHFRLIAYAESGVPLFGTNLIGVEQNFDQVRPQLPANAMLAADDRDPFLSVPYLFSHLSYPQGVSALEIEIGVLEPQVLRQFEAIASAQPNEAIKFLARNAGKVHLFRQRIPVRNKPQY